MIPAAAPSDGRDGFRPCAVVPSLDNPRTVRGVVERLAARLPVVLVDDGSGPDGAAACVVAAEHERVTLVRFEENRGKGAAVGAGFREADRRGFTHALQVDADAQHDLDRVEPFLEAAAAAPDALVLGYPVYDASAPRSRVIGRKVTAFWVAVELGDRTRIRDAMIGFRVYPLAASLATPIRSARMGFDIEIAVRMARRGVPIVNLPVAVRYPPAEEGGVSHFRPLRDNLAFCALHTRLCVGGTFSAIVRGLGRRSS